MMLLVAADCLTEHFTQSQACGVHLSTSTTVPVLQYYSSRAGLYYEEAFKAITMLGQNKYKKSTSSTKLVFYKTTPTQSGM